MNYKKILFKSFLATLFIFILISFWEKFFGAGNRFNHTSTEPLSWQETIDNIPINGFVSLLFGLLAFYVYWYRERQNNKKK